jgi:hypothetical protein
MDPLVLTTLEDTRLKFSMQHWAKTWDFPVEEADVQLVNGEAKLGDTVYVTDVPDVSAVGKLYQVNDRGIRGARVTQPGPVFPRWISATKLFLHELIFEPAANKHAAPLALFGVRMVRNTGSDRLISAISSVSITAESCNDAPTVADVVVTSENGAALQLIVQLVATDVESDAVSYFLSALPSVGAVYHFDAGGLDPRGAIISSVPVRLADTAGRLVYVPVAGDLEFGQPYATMEYFADDKKMDSLERAKVTVNILPSGDYVIAASQNFTFAEDTNSTFSMAGTAAGYRNIPAYVLSLPSNGKLHRVNRDGSLGNVIAYVPQRVDNGLGARVVFFSYANQFSPSDVASGTLQPYASFTYQLNDGVRVSNIVSANFIVTPVNDPPTSDNVNAVSFANEWVVVTLGGYDVDGVNDVASCVVDSLPVKGSVNQFDGSPILTAGTVVTDFLCRIIFTPHQSDLYEALWTYHVVDIGGLSSSISPVSVFVGGVNAKPIAVSGNVTMAEDGVDALITLQGYDPDGTLESLEFLVTIPPTRGTLRQIDTDAYPEPVGSFQVVRDSRFRLTYTPFKNLNGLPLDWFIFRVIDSDGARSVLDANFTINVQPVRDAPVTVAGSFSAVEDSTMSIELTGGDVDGDALQFIFISVPRVGTLFTNDGRAILRPNATVAAASEVASATNSSLTRRLLATPSASLHASFDAVEIGAHRAFLQQHANALRGTPSNLFLGAGKPVRHAQFHLRAPLREHSTVVTSRKLPRAVRRRHYGHRHVRTMSILEPCWLPCSVSSGDVTFVPPDNFDGVVEFDFLVSDGVLTSPKTGKVTLKMDARNDRPVASGTAKTMLEDGVVEIEVDTSDPDGDALIVIVATFLGQGTLYRYPASGEITREALAARGSVVATVNPQIAVDEYGLFRLLYVPPPNAFGELLGHYGFSVCDVNGLCVVDTKYITVNVTSVNDAPVAVPLKVVSLTSNAGIVKLPVTDVDDAAGDIVIHFDRLPAKGVLCTGTVAASLIQFPFTIDEVVAASPLDDATGCPTVLSSPRRILSTSDTMLSSDMLVFSSRMSGGGSPYASFEYHATDKIGLSSSTATLQLTIECPSPLVNNVWANGTVCATCLLGAVCSSGGDFYPISDAGFYRTFDSDQGLHFRSCLPVTSCPRAVPPVVSTYDSLITGTGPMALSMGQCLDGYTGFRCNDCLVGYFRVGKSCDVCPDAGLPPYLIAIIAGLVIGVGGLVFINAGDALGAIKIGVAFLQALSLIGSMNLRWPTSLGGMFDSVTVFDLDMGTFTSGCSSAFPRMSFSDRWRVSVIIPIVILVFFVTIALLYAVFLFLRDILWSNPRAIKAALNADINSDDSQSDSDASYSYDESAHPYSQAHSRTQSMLSPGPHVVVQSLETPAAVKWSGNGNAFAAPPPPPPPPPPPVQRRDADEIHRWSMSRASRNHWMAKWFELVRGYATVLLMLYLPLAKTAFSLYNCVPLPDGYYSLNADPALLCFAPWWDELTMPALAATLVYAAGIPTLMIYVLFVSRPLDYNTRKKWCFHLPHPKRLMEAKRRENVRGKAKAKDAVMKRTEVIKRHVKLDHRRKMVALLRRQSRGAGGGGGGRLTGLSRRSARSLFEPPPPPPPPPASSSSLMSVASAKQTHNSSSSRGTSRYNHMVRGVGGNRGAATKAWSKPGGGGGGGGGGKGKALTRLQKLRPGKALLLPSTEREQFKGKGDFEAREWRSLASRQWDAKYGTFTVVYKSDMFYWELMILLRKLLFSLVTALASAVPMMQATIVLMVLTMSVLMQIHFNPYTIKALNQLEFISLFSLLITLFCGLLFYGEEDMDEDSHVGTLLTWFCFVFVSLTCTAIVYMVGLSVIEQVKKLTYDWKHRKDADVIARKQREKEEKEEKETLFETEHTAQTYTHADIDDDDDDYLEFERRHLAADALQRERKVAQRRMSMRRKSTDTVDDLMYYANMPTHADMPADDWAPNIPGAINNNDGGGGAAYDDDASLPSPASSPWVSSTEDEETVAESDASSSESASSHSSQSLVSRSAAGSAQPSRSSPASAQAPQSPSWAAASVTAGEQRADADTRWLAEEPLLPPPPPGSRPFEVVSAPVSRRDSFEEILEELIEETDGYVDDHDHDGDSVDAAPVAPAFVQGEANPFSDDDDDDDVFGSDY